MARQINIKRTNSGSFGGNSVRNSVYTIDASSLCAPEAKEVNTVARLGELRKKMAEYNCAVYIIPSEDQHQSEYTAPIDQKRSFISGFSGSAGVAIVTRDVSSLNDVPDGLAALSTDGRYFNQASNELDFNWQLLKQGDKQQPTWEEWAVRQAIQQSLDCGDKVAIGVDPKLITYSFYQKFSATLKKELQKPNNLKAQVEILPVGTNLIDEIWEQFESIPPKVEATITLLDEKYHGRSIKDKLDDVAKAAFVDDVEGIVVSALDEVAWLLNLRGQDIEYNPVFFSFVIYTKSKTIVFVDDSRLSAEIAGALKQNNIEIQPYDSFYSTLSTISKDFSLNNKQFMVPNNANWEIVRNLKCSFTQGLSPVEDLKSIKNKTEIDGAKSAHLKDGRALIKFFAWLEEELIEKTELIDEITADDKLTEFRAQEEDFVGLSFATISATGANGAVIHYKPMKGSCSTIDPSKIYLNDSGSQFLDGTTDTTRTVHFGTPSAEEVRNYTLVLKGNIALATAKFPENTTGNLIDSIARQFLWKHGLDYGHGTSHGIGAYLNVHEGPIGIGPRPSAAANTLKPGHLLSNEPGFYKDGEYGIRIENVMITKDSGLKYNGRSFYEFETITRVPYCRKLIDVNLLTEEEINLINTYHQTIWDELNGSFEKSSYVYKWLRRETAPLTK